MKSREAKTSQPRTRQFTCQVPANHTVARIAKTNLQKKSAYNRTKQAGVIASKAQGNDKTLRADVNNSSNVEKTVKPTLDEPGQEKPPQGTKHHSIFVSSPRNYSEIAANVVRADCMNHGYRIERTVGEGAYAKVKLAEVLPSKLARNPIMAEIAQENDGTLQVAIKVIENKHVPKEFLKKFLPRELGNHCPLPAHINVVRVFDQFRTTDRIYVVMEYCSKGDMLDLINQRISESCKGLGEDLSRRLFKMMTEGLHHIHHNGIVHRDLKCENILLDRYDTLKITDFGFSTRFEHGKSSLLKTSCGSYAYTAPEVIKMKAYDGTKSDTWSLGVILFAMLNGRLPFNDAQLNELEEDMKMQRLRFERHVSFDAMVLVRRILQYNPSSRPSTDEILCDPWLTGKRLIPRQQNKPKWVNPYQARKEEGDVKGPEVVGTSPVYYKATVPERGPEATVTVNHEKNETVVLKSRTGNKKNIWISGPPTNHRPNTWPRSERDKVSGRGKPTRGSASTRGTSARCKNTTVIIHTPNTHGPQKKCPTSNCDSKARVSSRTIKMSKWFMEKYMNGKESLAKPETSSDCSCCKAEAAATPQLLPNCEKDDSLEVEEELCFDDLESIQPYPEFEDVRFPSPIKNESDGKFEPVAYQDTSAPKLDTKPEQDVESPLTTRTEYGTCKSAGASTVSTRGKSAVTRKPTVKSANVRTRTTTKQSSAPSKTPESNRRCFVNYMVSRSTSPAERVKYFRDRLMTLYGNTRVQQDGPHGLPPLMVLALKPPTSQPSSPEPPSQKLSGNNKRAGSSTRRPQRGKSGTTPKPLQRVVVHSAMP